MSQIQCRRPCGTECPHEKVVLEVWREQAWGQRCEDFVWLGLDVQPSADGCLVDLPILHDSKNGRRLAR